MLAVMVIIYVDIWASCVLHAQIKWVNEIVPQIIMYDILMTEHQMSLSGGANYVWQN